MKTETLKLSDMGTAGLLQWIAAGEEKLSLSKLPGIRAAKTARAAAIIRQRHSAESEAVFRKVARREAAARDAVARISAGVKIVCLRTLEESHASGVSPKEICRMADCLDRYADAVDQAK